MTVIHADHTQFQNAAEIPDPAADNNPETNLLDPDAPYIYAPPKDGDPWTTLLTPELEADSLRCNAWKEEVQNLLIFAGLFSAVVTTFIIESYKFPQPDPNIAIVGLLFHIASGLNSTSPLPPSLIPGSMLKPFSQAPSAVRINIFWFISLILSLTTVLVGTIALQWLREHQSYGGYSSKEKLAMLHMRSQAMEAWYLPQVFAALPLLLQTALVLFLAGLIDFSSLLGPKLTIPVSILVGLTLLFLTATTILPSLQGLSFFCGLYPRKMLPTPCPYKSPQSHAFRTLLGILLCAIFRSFPLPNLIYVGTRRWKIRNRSSLIPDYLAPYAHSLWYQPTWPTLDREWLSLRDACHQRILDGDPDLYQHQTFWKDSFPLSDVTQYLVEVVKQTPGSKHTDSFLAASVHCFNELADSIWKASDSIRGQAIQRKDRRNNYFERQRSEFSESCSLSKFLLHGGTYKFDQLSAHDLCMYLAHHSKVKQQLFCTDQKVVFLRILLDNHTSPALVLYHQELWLRVLRLSGDIAPLKPIIINGSESIPIPTIIENSAIELMISNELTPDQLFSNTADILTAIFGSVAAFHRVSQDWSTGTLCTHPQMLSVLRILASRTRGYLKWAQKDTPTKEHVLQDIDDQFIQLFKFMSDRLNEARSRSLSSSRKASLDVIFYLSSVFIWHLSKLCWSQAWEILRSQDSRFGGALRTLLDTLHKAWASGQKNNLIEKRFQGADYSIELEEDLQRFSDAWWSEIFKHITDDHPVIDQGALSIEGSPFDTVTSPFPATIYPSDIDDSLASDVQPRDDDINDHVALAPNLQPQSSRRESPSNPEDNANDYIPCSSFNLPSSNATDLLSKISQQDAVSGAMYNDFRHDKIYVAAGTRSLTVVPPVNEANPTPSDRDNLQPSEPYWAIDIEQPAVMERGIMEISESSPDGDHQQGKAEPDDAIIPIEGLDEER